MRNIIEGPDFATAVEKLGGYRLIDAALEPILDGLSKEPYGFERFENDWCSFRYARTRQIEGYVPALVIIFSIDASKNVVLEWVEEADDGELPE